MKMVKSLLLGSAASLVAVAGTQAADLPVKAKPVEYVKICSLYGDGFYYIPGTDFCVKFAGNAQADYNYNATGAGQPHYFQGTGLGGEQTRETSPFAFRARADFDVDARTQSEYGTVRLFTRLRTDAVDGAITPQVPRSFIQWAGWTFGRVKSLSDVPLIFADDGIRNLGQTQNHMDTGANGNNEISYSWELGNGMTLNLGGAERRAKPISNMSTVAWGGAGAQLGTTQSGMNAPDPYVSFQVNQAWGRVGFSATAKNLQATYYNATPGAPGYVPGAACTAQPGTTWCNHPGDEWGFGVAAGAIFNVPQIAPGDVIGAFVQYGQGGGSQATGNNMSSPGLFGGGNNVALGAITDAVYVNGSSMELTTAWSAGAGFMHWWTPTFATSVFGSYTEISYNDTVVNSRWFCGGGGSVVQAVNFSAAPVCDPGFKFFTVGAHTDWYPTPGLRLGVQVIYNGIDSNLSGNAVTLAKTGLRPSGTYAIGDDGIVTAIFRAQRRWPAGGE